VGLGRTGTTMLHRTIASDPRIFSLKWYESRNPAPFPDTATERAETDPRLPDPRIADAEAEVAMMLEASPDLIAAHPMDAHAPDEEIMLLEHAFISANPEAFCNVPEFARRLEDEDATAGYRYLKRLLQFLQWQKKESGRGGGRWVLKAPFHLGYLDVLFDVFPGTRVVQTHRDPLETIPSAASMYRSLWELNAEKVDPQLVGAQVCERYSWALTRCMRSRERYESDRFLDVDYRDVQRDPMAAVRRIYAWLGLDLTKAAEAAMSVWLAENDRSNRPAHHYTLAEFGFTESGLAEAFTEYRERHILPAGSGRSG